MKDLDLGKVFRFKIGDVCMHKAIEGVGPESRGWLDCRRIYIAERLLHECDGGIQLQYQTRYVMSSGDVSAAVLVFQEHELTLFSEPERPPPGEKIAK
jgi:hypothetical protein